MQCGYVNTVHSLSECKLSLKTNQNQSAHILHLRELLQAEDRYRATLEQQINIWEGHIRSLQADLNNLQQQNAHLASDMSSLATKISKLRREFGQAQAAVEDGLASIIDIIQQVDYLAPLEGQLTHSQVENINIRRQL